MHVESFNTYRNPVVKQRGWYLKRERLYEGIHSRYASTSELLRDFSVAREYEAPRTFHGWDTDAA